MIPEPEPGRDVRVTFTGTAEPVYHAGGHPDGDVVRMVPVRLASGHLIYVPLIPEIEIAEADPGAAGS